MTLKLGFDVSVEMLPEVLLILLPSVVDPRFKEDELCVLVDGVMSVVVLTALLEWDP